MHIKEILLEKRKLEYKYLYHLTDNSGFAYTIANNTLKSLRQNYISTTYDPNKNFVYGYSHYDFKFILNGNALIEKYGAFKHDHKARQDNKYVSLDEKEIGINTPKIQPFNEYLIAVVLLFPLFSQKAIQWFMYDNPGSESFDIPKEPAPRAIETLNILINEWKKPVFIQTNSEQRTLNTKEKQFLKDIFQIHKNGGDFKTGMLELSDKYSITDHNNIVLDRKTVLRRQKAKEIMNMYNDYFSSRKYKNVDPKVSQHLIIKTMQILDLNNNIQQTIIHELEKYNIFHQTIAPVDWTIIIKPLMNGDIDETIECIKHVAEKAEYKIKEYDNDPESYKYTSHVGSSMI